MKDFSKEIMAYALQNALEYGKADVSRVLPKLFQHGLKKEDIGKVMAEIQNVVKVVNSSSEKEREEIFEKVRDIIRKREEKEKTLPELKKAGKKMVFRLAPFPSGALHIGNARTYILNALYAERYNGKIILVMDDTIGSEEKQPDKNSYKLIEEGFKFLGINYEKPVVYKSDRLKIYYKYAEQLIRKGLAYVDHSSAEKIREEREKGIESGDRKLPADVQMLRWKAMFKAREGHAVLRIKTDMKHPNPAFRDRILFKISDRKHPRTEKKYRVWPSLEMSWAIDDHLLGVTHIIRGNDLVMETEMEKYIWDIFKWKHPEIVHNGLLTIKGIKMSKSKSQKEVRSGVYSGWDDPRTWSIQSLKERGIKKEAIIEFVKEFGLNKQDISVPIESLYAINRKMLDSESDRYSFIKNPVELKIKNPLKVRDIEVPVHPDRDEKRKIKVGGKIFISREDFEKYKGREVRLLHLYNLEISEKCKITSVENKKIPKINWVSENVEAKVLLPDGNWIFGIAEDAVGGLKKNQVIQFERFGFVKFQGKKKKVYEFWFGHK